MTWFQAWKLWSVPAGSVALGRTTNTPSTGGIWVRAVPSIVTVAGATANVTIHGSAIAPVPVAVDVPPVTSESAVATSAAVAFQAMAAVGAPSTLSVKVPPVKLPTLTLYMSVAAGATPASGTLRNAGSIVTVAGATANAMIHGSAIEPVPVAVAEMPARSDRAPATSAAAAFQAMSAVVAPSTLSVKVPAMALPTVALNLRVAAGVALAGTTIGGGTKSVANARPTSGLPMLTGVGVPRLISTTALASTCGLLAQLGYGPK